ncbi:hypothetical protein RRG08_011652 [Elysia crispata]|uniref:Uncharacterized protein n=1 Tax=Elysia crispata TaxID=231223 RepID=A0AAE0YLW5_9GAST|nr:hypothetical protein RRG08_011652 [Elysia crispata]
MPHTQVPICDLHYSFLQNLGLGVPESVDAGFFDQAACRIGRWSYGSALVIRWRSGAMKGLSFMDFRQADAVVGLSPIQLCLASTGWLLAEQWDGESRYKGR